MYLHTASIRLMHIPIKHLLDACWYKANTAFLVHVELGTAKQCYADNFNLYEQVSSYDMLVHDELCVCLSYCLLWFSLLLLTFYVDYQEHASTYSIVMFNNKVILKCQHHLYICAVMCPDGEMYGWNWLRQSMAWHCMASALHNHFTPAQQSAQQTKRDVHLAPATLQVTIMCCHDEWAKCWRIKSSTKKHTL